MQSKLRAVSFTLIAASLMASFAPAAQAGLTGHIDVVSKYVLRGITTTYGTSPAGNAGGDAPESDGPALQGGVDYVADSGFYIGYWFSTLGYNYEALSDSRTPKDTNRSTEHDFYAGYNGKTGAFGYTVGATVYYYSPGWESTGFETKLGVSYGGFGLTAQTLLNDVTYGNTGDTYWVASYTHALPKDFTFTGQLAAYTYEKEGDWVKGTTESAGFRHLTLGVTKPIASTGATLGLQYIVGGDNRYGVKQDNQLVGSLSVAF